MTDKQKKPIPQNVKDKIRYFLLVILKGWVELLEKKETEE